MQVGYATGDEYPNTGRILTHRVLYWARAVERQRLDKLQIPEDARTSRA